MRLNRLNRRAFITLIGSATVSPMTVRGQQRLQRVGVLMNLGADDPEAQLRLKTFVQELRRLGRSEGKDVQIEVRWATGDMEKFRQLATELLAGNPEVILAASTPAVVALQAVSQTVPIVFANVVDAVGAGLVDGLSRPGRNATGFIYFEYGISVKWLELLRDIAPGLKHAAVLREAATLIGARQMAVIQAAASSFDIEVHAIGLRDPNEIQSGITSLAHSGKLGGLVVTASTLTGLHRKLIISLAADHRAPAIYPFRYFAVDGGVISYGPETTEPFRLAAGYVDRILKGERPADLPVQAPTRYELVINMKTARELGVELPAQLLARADEVIE